MPSNACLAKKCHYYLQPLSRLSHHNDIWGYSLPKLFHSTVKKHYTKTAVEIFKEYKKIFDNKFDFEKYKTSEEEVLKYIQMLKDEYKKL